MEKRFTVFVSSTYKDLEDERKEVSQAISECNCFPTGMEIFPAVSRSACEMIKKVIDNSNIYLIILGGKYTGDNSQLITDDNGKEVSYTEWEFDYAVKTGKPIIAFIHKNPQRIATEYTESKYIEKLKHFREKVCDSTQRVAIFWENINGLKNGVIRSLSNIIANESNHIKGWVREETIQDLLSDNKSEIEEKNETIKKLNIQIKKLSEELKVCEQNIKIGGVIWFGEYKWEILDIKDNCALLISKDVVEVNIPYNNDYVDVTWRTCTIRKWLNNDFYNTFNIEEKNRIIERQIVNENNLWYNTDAGSATTDKFFLLSISEADIYFGNSGDYNDKKKWSYIDGNYILDKDNGRYLHNSFDNKRIVENRNGKKWWWLRSPGYNNDDAACVDSNGVIRITGRDVDNASNNGGVRPAFWLSLPFVEI